MLTVYKEIEVDVDLEDFETEELIEELKNRDPMLVNTCDTALVEQIFHLRRRGQSYEQELDQLIYSVTGRIA